MLTTHETRFTACGPPVCSFFWVYPDRRPTQGLSLVDRAPIKAPIATLVSAEVDDGFGAAVAVHGGDVWIGAPHGPEGRLYRWASSEMTVAQSGSGRLGAHLSSTETSLLVSAPLSDRVTDQDGEQVFAGRPSVGIALSSAGDAAWAGGWITPEGAEGVTPGRPGALHRDGNQLAVGLPHGPVALAVGEQQLMRPAPGDEAGFSLSSAEVSGQEAWIVGAPAANRVFAVSKDDLGVIAEWTGGGRLGTPSSQETSTGMVARISSLVPRSTESVAVRHGSSQWTPYRESSISMIQARSGTAIGDNHASSAHQEPHRRRT